MCRINKNFLWIYINFLCLSFVTINLSGVVWAYKSENRAEVMRSHLVDTVVVEFGTMKCALENN
jgi:hypothetical protein